MKEWNIFISYFDQDKFPLRIVKKSTNPKLHFFLKQQLLLGGTFLF
jgi:hypothetical protein